MTMRDHCPKAKQRGCGNVNTELWYVPFKKSLNELLSPCEAAITRSRQKRQGKLLSSCFSSPKKGKLQIVRETEAKLSTFGKCRNVRSASIASLRPWFGHFRHPVNGRSQTAPACRKSATGLNRSRGRALRRAAWPWMDERVA